MNEIVVTGSTGVIGQRAVRELLARADRVTRVTRSQRGHERLETGVQMDGRVVSFQR